ncbi:MAG: MtnX-like HAD-IB family phosphatase [Tissierellaceae bacterium]|nr:MtnX-like HAD-IB family phosphatase [Tissierellaceae bacterium]
MTENFLEKVAILIDFDGTITKKDSNDLLMEKLLSNRFEEISQREEDLNFMDFFSSLFNEINMTEEEYLEFILKEVELSEGFYEFYKKAKSYNIPLAVVSGGFVNGIVPFLKKHGIEDIDVFANRLNFEGDKVVIEYYHNIDDCCEIGSCGNCKVLHYQSYKRDNFNVIFIGDGITDRSVASKADIVFAKDGLLKYCNENNIDCIPWNDFDDISRIIFKE